MKKAVLYILISILSFSVNAEEVENQTELNFFTGMFDWSDHKQKSTTIGLQHQNEDLFRNSFLGKISPITGGMLTDKNAFYLWRQMI